MDDAVRCKRLSVPNSLISRDEIALYFPDFGLLELCRAEDLSASFGVMLATFALRITDDKPSSHQDRPRTRGGGPWARDAHGEGPFDA